MEYNLKTILTAKNDVIAHMVEDYHVPVTFWMIEVKEGQDRSNEVKRMIATLNPIKS